MIMSTITVFILVPAFFDLIKKGAIQEAPAFPSGSMSEMAVYRQPTAVSWLLDSLERLWAVRFEKE
jgi:hypothetical protein